MMVTSEITTLRMTDGVCRRASNVVPYAQRTPQSTRMPTKRPKVAPALGEKSGFCSVTPAKKIPEQAQPSEQVAATLPRNELSEEFIIRHALLAEGKQRKDGLTGNKPAEEVAVFWRRECVSPVVEAWGEEMRVKVQIVRAMGGLS
jgi:hypothetical protein